MKIEHLQYFIVLANSSSISKAAEKLFISQQQLNRIITSLEEEVQTKLLSRTTNGVSLTEEGQDFLAYARNIVSEYSALRNHFYLRQSPDNFHLQTPQAECKAFLTPCLSIYASEIIHNLQKIAPNIKLTLYDKTTKLNENYFDDDALCFWAVAITPDDLLLPDGQRLQALTIGESQAYFVYNKVLHQFEQAPRNSNDLMTFAFSHVYADTPHKEKLNLVSANVHQLLDSVVQNDTICTLPDFVLPKVQPLYPDIAFLHMPEMLSSIYVVHPASHPLTDADDIVINFMKSYIQNLQLLAKLNP